MAERCRWIIEQYKFASTWGAEEIHRYGDEFELFLKESGHLCENELKTRLEDNPPIYSSRLASSEVNCTFLNFSAETKEEAKQRTLGFDALDFKSALTDPGLLRSTLALGIGLNQTNRMVNLIEQQQYVLTPDFALKLLILNERRKVRQNVIFCGNTGVGKTELMSLFSLVINSDSDILPDILYETSKLIYDSILHDDSRRRPVLRCAEFNQWARAIDPSKNKIKVIVYLIEVLIVQGGRND